VFDAQANRGSPSCTRRISGVCDGSDHPAGAFMWAMEMADSPLFTRPTYSKITLPPGTCICAADAINSG